MSSLLNAVGAAGNASSIGSFIVGDLGKAVGLSDYARHTTEGPGDFLGTSSSVLDAAFLRLREFASSINEDELQELVEKLEAQLETLAEANRKYSKKGPVHRFFHYPVNFSRHKTVYNDIAELKDVIMTSTQQAYLRQIKERIANKTVPPSSSNAALPTYPPPAAKNPFDD